MACFHPLTAIINPNSLTVNGKKSMQIVSAWHDLSNVPEELIMKLPCGQCAGCRIQKSREWADRCMMELQYHESAYFVTLTYDDFHVPKSFYPSEDIYTDYYGECIDEPNLEVSLTLCKRDWQLFMKRLRRRFKGQKLRFFMAGEYGSKTFRPHFHAIIFGLKLDDLVPYKRSQLGHAYYNSESLSSCWTDKDGNSKGFAVVAEVTWETCAYVARYVMKKRTGPEAEFYKKFNIEPEFTLMSRKPGIARMYYDEHPDIYDHDYINLKTDKGGLKFRPPRYFDKLYDLECPDELENIKNIRKKLAVEAQKAKLQRTTVSPDELLAIEERSFERKINTLRRTLE